MFSIFCLFLYAKKYYLLFNLFNQKLHAKAFSLKRKWKILFMYGKLYKDKERKINEILHYFFCGKTNYVIQLNYEETYNIREIS